jgi:hypothetical protein
MNNAKKKQQQQLIKKKGRSIKGGMAFRFFDKTTTAI